MSGVSTVICTSDARLFSLLDDAVDVWNSALPDSSVGDDGTESLLHLHKTSSGGVPTGANACSDQNVAGGVDVVAAVGDCEGDPIACYRRGRDANTGRMEFSTGVHTDDCSDPYASTEHATIMYETDNISDVSAAVLIHELGHVRGLRELERQKGIAIEHTYPSQYPAPGVSPDLARQDIATAERNRLALGDGPLLRLYQLHKEDVGLRVVSIALPSADRWSVRLHQRTRWLHRYQRQAPAGAVPLDARSRVRTLSDYSFPIRVRHPACVRTSTRI